jgi:hypothetical protein
MRSEGTHQIRYSKKFFPGALYYLINNEVFPFKLLSVFDYYEEDICLITVNCRGSKYINLRRSS